MLNRRLIAFSQLFLMLILPLTGFAQTHHAVITGQVVDAKQGAIR